MKTKLAARLLIATVAVFALAVSASAQQQTKERLINERIILVNADEPKPGEKPAEKPPVVVTDPGCNPCPQPCGKCKPCCQKPCREPMVCVPEPDIRKTTKTVFSSKESSYCLKKCSFGCCKLFGRHRKDCCDPCDPCANPCAQACNACPTGECDCVRYKNVLLKRVVTTECPDYKCVPKPAPCCNPCGVPCGQGVIIEKIPEPAPKPMPK